MQQSRLIWFAITFSTIPYFLVAYVTSPMPARPFEEVVQMTITLALYGAALASFIAALVIPAVVTQSAPQQKMILSLALFEACAICGLTAALIQHDWRIYIPTWIAALLGMLREFPKNE
jgi:hypothetical protein